MTRWPAATNLRVMAAPKPAVAPVTKTIMREPLLLMGREDGDSLKKRAACVRRRRLPSGPQLFYTRATFHSARLAMGTRKIVPRWITTGKRGTRGLSTEPAADRLGSRE
jgi:hypothetical protein